MQLTGKPLRGSGLKPKAQAQTTTPGFTNPNQQMLVRDTGAPLKARDGQSVYELRCGKCGFAYGCNGMDVKARLCPQCQGGTAGEVLRERERGLFD